MPRFPLLRRAPWLLLLASCGGENLVLPDDGAPRRLLIESGNDQQAPAGATLPDSIVLRVTDGTGRPVQDAPVGVTLQDGGSVAPAALRSGADGRVTFEWTLGRASGPQQLEVGIGDSTGITRTVTIDAMAAAGTVDSLDVVSGNQQVGQVNKALAESLVVRALDRFGNPVEGATVQWVPSAGGIAPITATTDAAGRAAGAWTLGRTPGTQKAVARVQLSGSRIDAPFSANALASTPPALSIATQPSSSATADVPFAQQPVIQLRGADGQPVSTSGVAVTASVSGGTATLAGTATVSTNNQGRATFSNLALNGPSGSHTLTFTAPGYLAATSSAISLTAASPDMGRSTISASPTSLAVGATSTITVTVRSSSGAPVPGATVTLAATGTGNTLTQPSSPTNSSGVATGTLSSTTAGARTVTAKINTRDLGKSVSVTFQASSATILGIVSGDDQTAQTGKQLANPLVVRVLDPFGNPINNVTVNWQAASGTVNPTSDRTDRNGLAQTRWTLGATAGTQTATARISVLGVQLSVTFSATATAPPQPVLGVRTQPSDSAIDGVPLARQPVIELLDDQGAPVAQAGVAVTATASGGATLGGTRTQNTDGQGRAAFTDLVLSGTTGQVTLSFAASGYTGVNATPVTLLSAAPSPGASSFTVAPTSVEVDSPITVTVQVRNAGGQPVAGAGVTLSASGQANTITQPPPTDSAGITTGTVSSTRAETKTISVLLAGQSVGSGQDVIVTPGPADAGETTAQVPDGHSGSPTTIVITTRDRYANPLTTGGLAGSLAVLVTGLNLAAPTAQDQGDGTYTATYTPLLPSSDTVFITLGGVPIRGSPFTSAVD